MSKVIIDSDPGVDDALALLMALKAGVPIDSVCTVFGNATVENTTRNALAVLSKIGGRASTIEVHQGASSPLAGEATLSTSHGGTGLGVNFKYPEEPLLPTSNDAVEAYIRKLEQAEDNEYTIIAIGPLTNIASVVTKRPDLLKSISQLIILGGVVGEAGNISPYAEFNIYNDPKALEVVLAQGGLDIVVIPINICRAVTINFDDLKDVSSSNSVEFVSSIIGHYVDYYLNDEKYGGMEGAVMYDLLAVAYYLQLDLFETTPCCLAVETDSERYGMTYVTDGAENCKLVTKADAVAVKDLFFSLITN